MTYVDGFVIPLPEGKEEAYRAIASEAGKIWMDHGALAYKECIGDDMGDKDFCMSFPDAFRTKEGETVIFAFIIYKSREDRDAINAKVMADPRMAQMPKEMPFDIKRMTYGGFRTIVDL